jgi:hypothetical protein
MMVCLMILSSYGEDFLFSKIFIIGMSHFGVLDTMWLAIFKLSAIAHPPISLHFPRF